MPWGMIGPCGGSDALGHRDFYGGSDALGIWETFGGKDALGACGTNHLGTQMPWGILGFIFILVESVDICSSRRIGNAPELRQLVSCEAHASFRFDPIGSVDYYASNKSL